MIVAFAILGFVVGAIVGASLGLAWSNRDLLLASRSKPISKR